MALGRFVVTADTTIAAGTPVAVAGGFGTVSWSTPAGPYGGPGATTLRKGMIVVADSTGGTGTGAQQLYNAIGAGNLRAFVQGTDDVGHAGISN